jgi:hypothetical protein
METGSAFIHSSEDIATFLIRALAGGALAVGELDAGARATGLVNAPCVGSAMSDMSQAEAMPRVTRHKPMPCRV